MRASAAAVRCFWGLSGDARSIFAHSPAASFAAAPRAPLQFRQEPAQHAPLARISQTLFERFLGALPLQRMRPTRSRKPQSYTNLAPTRCRRLSFRACWTFCGPSAVRALKRGEGYGVWGWVKSFCLGVFLFKVGPTGADSMDEAESYTRATQQEMLP